MSVDDSVTFGEFWHSSEVNGVLTNTNSSSRLITINIESEKGFIIKAELIFKARTSSGSLQWTNKY